MTASPQAEAPTTPVEAMVPAAVLVPLIDRRAGMTVLLTQRTEHLNDHAGQISFPGGRAEDRDADPIDTALRETEEEIGLTRDRIEVVGCLDTCVTGTSAHSNRGTIGAHVPEKLVRASIEKNRHLFAWKHLDGEALEAYLDGLGEELADAVASEDRERLAWLSLALDQLPEALQARRRAQALSKSHTSVASNFSLSP